MCCNDRASRRAGIDGPAGGGKTQKKLILKALAWPVGAEAAEAGDVMYPSKIYRESACRV